jgi:hypothetical protein
MNFLMRESWHSGREEINKGGYFYQEATAYVGNRQSN